MTQTKKLSLDEINAAVKKMPSWKLNSQQLLESEFKFKNFPEAFSFMTRVAFEAERMDHHPNWSNTYNLVKIELTTHDAGGITDKDLDLARRITAISWI